SVAQLSTGLRINTAADDPTGLQVTQRLRGQIIGLQQASRNTQDGMSFLDSAEGALQVTHSLLSRMRELAVQSPNGTLTASDRDAVQNEVDQLINQVDSLALGAQFNTLGVIDGTAQNVAL